MSDPDANRLVLVPHLTVEECELLLHGLARLAPGAWFATKGDLGSFLPDEIVSIGGSLATALREAIMSPAPGPDDPRLETATAALGERWYAYGPNGPTEHGWMRELAAAAIAGADKADRVRRTVAAYREAGQAGARQRAEDLGKES